MAALVSAAGRGHRSELVGTRGYTAGSETFQEPDWTRRGNRRIVGPCALGFPLPSYGGRLCLRAPASRTHLSEAECGAQVSGTDEHSTLTTRKRALPGTTEVIPLAAARNASTTTTPKNGRGASRLSFAKISDTLTVPDLLALQTESFDWLVGNDAWKTRVAEAKSIGRTDVPEISGLEEIFEEISPIEDLSETMQLSFTNPYLEPEKYSIDECKERGKTYAAPLYVEAEFMNHQTGEIKTQTVFMGDFPLQTGKGTFIINGTERVVVSQLVRSPGVYFDRTPDKTSDKDIVSARIIPSRGAWLEFEIDKRDQVGVRIDRKRKQSVTVFLKALGLTSEQILEEFAGFDSIEETLSKDTIRARAAGQLLLQRQALRPGEGGSLQDQPEARSGRAPVGLGPDRRRHRRDDQVPGAPAPRRHDVRRSAGGQARRDPPGHR